MNIGGFVVHLPSRIQLFETSWTAAHQASPDPHHLLEFAQVHVYCISDSIQPSCSLMPSSPALDLSQHQGLFQ